MDLNGSLGAPFRLRGKTLLPLPDFAVRFANSPEKLMGRAFSFIGLIIVVAIIMYLYARQTTSLAPGVEGSTGNPKSTINLVGVKNDLLRFATAERQHMASEGHYVSLSEMRAAGDTGLPEDSRGPFDYSIDASGDSFTATATYRGTPTPGVPKVLKVGKDGQVQQEE